MRKEEIDFLNQPYDTEKDAIDRRFNSAIGADVPSAKKLVKEIFDDFDTNFFGIKWWTLPNEERILIGDYLYQCANGIEENLVEAKLHFFEWLDAKEKRNKRIVNIVSRDSVGRLIDKIPKSNAPIDDLPNKLEKMHICGFLRAIGSCVDCLGAVIIGVLALPTDLRKSDMNKARAALKKIEAPVNQGAQLQIEFKDFLEKIENASGPNDWLKWAEQYRNMFVHRGRRIIFTKTCARKHLFYDSKEQIIPRSESTTHLAKFPDRSDVEAFIKSEEIILNEDAQITLTGIFDSCRNLSENICDKLLSIWIERRNNPLLLEQPQNQWSNLPKECNFTGYNPKTPQINMDVKSSHPNIFKRMLSASVFGKSRTFWKNSKWE